jgi:hypothetical protein
MKMWWKGIVLLLVLAAASWAGWHYWNYRTCLELCAPSATEQPIRLASGGSLRVISVSRTEDDPGRIAFVRYVTALDTDRDDAGLCREAKEVSASLRQTGRVSGVSQVLLVPTNPRAQLLGFSGLLLQLSCCRSSSLLLQVNGADDWQFEAGKCAGT